MSEFTEPVGRSYSAIHEQAAADDEYVVGVYQERADVFHLAEVDLPRLLPNLGRPRSSTVSKALVAAARLLLPFDEGWVALAGAVGRLAGSSLSSAPAVLRALEVLRRVAASTAISGDDYLAAIRGRGEPPPTGEGPDRGSGGEPADATTGQLVQAEMEALAGRPAALAEALRSGIPARDLDWSPILRRLSTANDRAAGCQAGLLLPARLSSPAELHSFVLAASAVGAVELAEAATRQVVDSGQPYSRAAREWRCRSNLFRR